MCTNYAYYIQAITLKFGYYLYSISFIVEKLSGDLADSKS